MRDNAKILAPKNMNVRWLPCVPRLDIAVSDTAWLSDFAATILGDEVKNPKFQQRLAEFDLHRVPGHLLRLNAQRSLEILRTHVGDDVTRQQIALLITLAKNPGASQRILVEATGIDKSTVKEMLERMVARGWVKRERDREDKRAWTMSITPLGNSLLADRMPAVAAAQREILAPLPEEHRAIFLRYLRVLIGREDLES